MLTPQSIAMRLTNPILGAYPDFSDVTRPVVMDAIIHGIEIDRAQHEPEPVDPAEAIRREAALKLSTLNVYAPKLAEKIIAQRDADIAKLSTPQPVEVGYGAV